LTIEQSKLRNKKGCPRWDSLFKNRCAAGLTLAGFEPALRFVDHVHAAFATHNAAITVPVLDYPSCLGPAFR